MVEIIHIDSGFSLDLIDTNINYVRQVANIGDFTKINDSYSWQFKIPKTVNNKKFFDGLGIVGSESASPYISINIQMLVNGASIINKGKLIVTETTREEYKAHIKDGAINFFEDIGSDSLSDLNLSELSHKKTVENIVNTLNQNRQDYKYLIGWFGMPLLESENGTTNIPANGLLPFINFRFIFNKIEEKYGWKINGLNSFLQRTYLSSKANEEGGEDYRAGDFNIGDPFTNAPLLPSTYYRINLNQIYLDTEFATYNNATITIQDSGGYTLSVFPDYFYYGYGRDVPVDTDVYINNLFYERINSTRKAEIDLNLSQGDIIDLRVMTDNDSEVRDFEYHSKNGYFRVIKKDTEFVDFSVLIGNLKIKDILKEVFIRNASTIYFDAETKTITAQSINIRLSSKAVDLSRMYVERINESYTFSDYAIENIISHKYNEGADSYDDGTINIENENLKATSELYNSFAYTKEERGVLFLDNNISYAVEYLKSFEIENSEKEDDIKYKPLKDRYFISEFDFNSSKSIYINGTEKNGIPFVNMQKTAYKNIIKNWEPIYKLLDKTKIIKCIFRMSSFDFSNIDLSKPIYLDQEKSYFVINSISLKKNKEVEAELVKINNYKELKIYDNL